MLVRSSVMMVRVLYVIKCSLEGMMTKRNLFVLYYACNFQKDQFLNKIIDCSCFVISH